MAPAREMTCLLDSSVLIDALNDRNGRPGLLSQISQQGVLLACCAVNVTELYMGMRPSEEAKTEKVSAQPGILSGDVGDRATHRSALPPKARERSDLRLRRCDDRCHGTYSQADAGD